MEQRVIDLFHRSIEAKMANGEALAAPIANSATRIVEALLADARVFTCGNGISGSHATSLNYLLQNQYRIERPGFAALCLSTDAIATSGISQQNSFNEIYSRQLRALSRPGDLLVMFSANSNATNLVQAVQTAHDRDMTVIALTGEGDNNISALMNGNDIEIRVHNRDPYSVQEIHFLCLLCICELIEQQLFGG
jgi:D-sedoheptulose 7-phosphate isomerase